MTTKKEWVITPDLLWYRDRFKAHLDAAGDDPVLVSGPRGVGKSLFLELAKIDYQESKGVERVNCAHFQGDLARSELFGYKKGAFTGAAETRPGWIEKADGKVLILEEIGTLPEDVQAKLLTVIEDGEFHKVGSTATERTDVQIIAATNDPSRLRPDFKDRFFEFQIPPLHERRGDILYYLGWHFPHLVSRLTPADVLALLSYHWPGNVRELMQAGKVFEKERIFEEMQEKCADQGLLNFKRDNEDPLREAGKFKDTALYEVLLNDMIQFLGKIKQYGIETKEIEKVFNNELSVDLGNNKKVFNNFKKEHIKNQKEDSFVYLINYEKFTNVELNFFHFCNIFFRDHFSNDNLLKDPETWLIPAVFPSHTAKKKVKAIASIEKKALEMIMQQKGALKYIDQLPSPYTEEFDQLMKRLEGKQDTDGLLDQLEAAFEQSEDKKGFFNQLKGKVLARIVEKEGGKKKAADRLGWNRNTLSKKLPAQNIERGAQNSVQEHHDKKS